jgi:pectate lyase
MPKQLNYIVIPRLCFSILILFQTNIGPAFSAPALNACVGKSIKLEGPFKNESGFAYYAPLKGMRGDSNEMPTVSKLLLCENGTLLTPAHALHENIRKIGKGSYSHWGEGIYFSTSNNSDPNKNSNVYTVIYPK